MIKDVGSFADEISDEEYAEMKAREVERMERIARGESAIKDREVELESVSTPPKPRENWETGPLVKWTQEQVEMWLRHLPEKIQDPSQVPKEAIVATIEWAKAWRGDFEYMQSMQEQIRKTHSLSMAQCKGVLNCWRADILRADRLIQAAKNAVRAEGEFDLRGVPSGKYAAAGEDGVLRFFSISNMGPRHPKWADWVFVEIQAGPDYHRLGSSKPSQGYKGGSKFELEQVDKDPQAAMARYGHEIGKCGRCGRALTDEKSRELGIGPVCIHLMGW